MCIGKRRKQRQEFFDGSDDFDADLDDEEFDDAGKEKEFESVRQTFFDCHTYIHTYIHTYSTYKNIQYMCPYICHYMHPTYLAIYLHTYTTYLPI